MSIGIVGTVRPSDVEIDDICVYYNYAKDRETNSSEMISIKASDVLSYCYLPSSEQLVEIGTDKNILEGLYNLTLPASTFNQIGFYTIYIKPTGHTTTILDCGVLSAMPTTKGIILDSNLLPQSLRSNNAMQGYKIEYINQDNTKMRNVVRFVITSNKVVPVQENVGNTSQKAIRYRLDDSGTLIFLQLTPSSASEVKPNVLPFIGIPTQQIILSNTNFSPLAIEVEFVKDNVQTLADVLIGNQLKDADNGILTLFDGNDAIREQYDIYQIKDNVTGTQLFEVKEKRTDIDIAQTIANAKDPNS
jgi:hypothetical protein